MDRLLSLFEGAKDSIGGGLPPEDDDDPTDFETGVAGRGSNAGVESLSLLTKFVSIKIVQILSILKKVKNFY